MNIVIFEEQKFRPVRGLPFKYCVEDNYVIPDRTNYPLVKSEFKKAVLIPNLQGSGQINDLVRGPSYIYAILSDDNKVNISSLITSLI